MRSPTPVATLDLKRVPVGTAVHHPLLIVDIQARAGEHARTTLVLGNATGRIETAPFWAGRDDAIRGLRRGMAVQVIGRVVPYREGRQLDVGSMHPLPPGAIPFEQLVPSVADTAPYWNYLDDVRRRLTAPRLRCVVDLFYTDTAFRERYDRCPGSPGWGHHAMLGGLLQHTCEVVRIGQSVARVARADVELVTVGAMLHDIGKIRAYRWEDGVFEHTVRGRLIGHVADGVLMLRDAVQRSSPAPCTEEEHLLLEHIILSHHGKQEFGAPISPATLEAQIVHFADDASAKTASINEGYDAEDLFPDGQAFSARKPPGVSTLLYRSNVDWGRPPGQ